MSRYRYQAIPNPGPPESEIYRMFRKEAKIMEQRINEINKIMKGLIPSGHISIYLENFATKTQIQRRVALARALQNLRYTLGDHYGLTIETSKEEVHVLNPKTGEYVDTSAPDGTGQSIMNKFGATQIMYKRIIPQVKNPRTGRYVSHNTFEGVFLLYLKYLETKIVKSHPYQALRDKNFGEGRNEMEKFHRLVSYNGIFDTCIHRKEIASKYVAENQIVKTNPGFCLASSCNICVTGIHKFFKGRVGPDVTNMIFHYVVTPYEFITHRIPNIQEEDYFKEYKMTKESLPGHFVYSQLGSSVLYKSSVLGTHRYSLYDDGNYRNHIKDVSNFLKYNGEAILHRFNSDVLREFFRLIPNDTRGRTFLTIDDINSFERRLNECVSQDEFIFDNLFW